MVRSRRLLPVALLFGAVLSLAFGLRLYMAERAFFSTFDTSTVGLMAMHILDGERPLFYYGQSYMGALEAYVAALLFRLLGVSTTALSTAAILFALAWVAVTWGLFAELFGRRAGAAAALCAAVPGWYPLWFTLATNGGYPETYFFGTLFLWMALRLAKGEDAGGAQWGQAAVMGGAAAFGVWTNFQVFSYLATGGAILLFALTRSGGRTLLAKVAAAAAAGLAGFLPLLLLTWRGERVSGEVASLHLGNAGRSLALLPAKIPALFDWPSSPRALTAAAALVWIGACALYLSRLAAARGRERFFFALPLLFGLLFLAMFLPHSLAQVRAPRYLVPLMTVLTCGFFAAAASHPLAAPRRAGTLLLGLWTAFNLSSALATAEAKAPHKEKIVSARERIVEAAEGLGLRHVVILGSPVNGHEGQSLTFYARDRVRFVSSWYERYQPAAQSAELGPGRGFLTGRNHLQKVARSLAVAGVAFETAPAGKSVILHSLAPPRRGRRSIAPDGISLRLDGGEAAALLDRRAGTVVALPPPGEEISMVADLGRPRSLAGLCLVSSTGRLLLGRGRMAFSLEGERFETIFAGDLELLPAYSAGDEVYAMGYESRYDLRFEPVRARYLRLRLASSSNGEPPQEIDEIFLFEEAGPMSPVPEAELTVQAARIADKGIDFTVADRWMSACLIDRLQASPELPPAYPRFNPRAPRTCLPRSFAPRPGLALLVETAFADECVPVLEGALPPGASLEREDYSRYTLFTFGGGGSLYRDREPTLHWKGFTVLAGGKE